MGYGAVPVPGVLEMTPETAPASPQAQREAPGHGSGPTGPPQASHGAGSAKRAASDAWGQLMGEADRLVEEQLEMEARLPKPYYDEDGITIYCGDCREILPHLPKVDLVLTDPHSVSTNNATLVSDDTQGKGQDLGEAAFRDRMALHQSDVVAGEDRSALRGVAGRAYEGDAEARHRVDWTGEARQAQRALQRRHGEHAVSGVDPEGQMLQMQCDGAASDSPQKRGSSRQPFRESAGALRLLSQQFDQASLVGRAQIICITDPPYGIALSNHARGKERRDMDWTIRNDTTQECGAVVLAMLQRIPTLAFASPMRPWAGKWKQHLAWEKGEHVSGGGDPATCWKPSWELLQVRNTGLLNGSRDGAVLRFLADKDDYALHPTPKPTSLLRYLIGKVSRPGDIILDPFMGSGTTLVAAKQLGRRAIGIEIEEKYCQIAVDRLRQAVFQFDEPAPEPEQLGLLDA